MKLNVFYDIEKSFFNNLYYSIKGIFIIEASDLLKSTASLGYPVFPIVNVNSVSLSVVPLFLYLDTSVRLLLKGK